VSSNGKKKDNNLNITGFLVLVTVPRKRAMKEKIEFSAFSPTDYRYAVAALNEFLSEEAFVQYKARVEAAIARGFANDGILSNDLCDEMLEPASPVNAEAVYDEELRTKHDIRALVNVIKSKVSDDACEFCHF
jgi:adenylosuccinate lyase